MSPLSIVFFSNFSALNSLNKREATKGSDSSASCNSPVERKTRWLLSSSNFSPEPSAEVSLKVFEIPTIISLEWTVAIILTRLETMDEKLEKLSSAVSNSIY